MPFFQWYIAMGTSKGSNYMWQCVSSTGNLKCPFFQTLSLRLPTKDTLYTHTLLLQVQWFRVCYLQNKENAISAHVITQHNIQYLATTLNIAKSHSSLDNNYVHKHNGIFLYICSMKFNLSKFGQFTYVVSCSWQKYITTMYLYFIMMLFEPWTMVVVQNRDRSGF